MDAETMTMLIDVAKLAVVPKSHVALSMRGDSASLPDALC